MMSLALGRARWKRLGGVPSRPIGLPCLGAAGTANTEKLDVHVTTDRGTAIFVIIFNTAIFALIHRFALFRGPINLRSSLWGGLLGIDFPHCFKRNLIL